MTNATQRQQRGAIAILAGMLIVILFAFGAFAIDIANLILVKGELQNAADAAAQAGAQCLYRRTECANMSSQVPDFPNAKLRAESAAPSNAVQGVAVSSSEVKTGFWNITGTPGTLQPNTTIPTANDFPAVQATISKESGKNGGAVVYYLARMMALFDTTGSATGLDSADISATAISVVTPPGLVPPGGLFPFAIAKCMYDEYWNSQTGQPATATSTAPLNGEDQIIGAPYIFRLGVSGTTIYTVPSGKTCNGGQWTPLDNSTSAGTSTIVNYIQKDPAHPSPQVAIGDMVYIRSGVTSAYQPTQDCSLAYSGKCGLVTVLVTADVDKGTSQEVKAFGCMQILNADPNGKEKYIRAQMSTACPPYGGGIGPNYGAVNPPQLAF